MTTQAVGFGPEDQGGGGLFDDFDGTITGARFVPFDYQGTRDPVTAMQLTIDNPDADEPIVEHYPIGGGFVPNPENEQEFVPETPADAERRVSKRCKLAIFSNEAINAGVPASEIVNNVGVFVGLSGHFLKKAIGKGSNSYEVLVLSTVTWPKGKAAGKAKGRATTTTKAARKVDGTGDVDEDKAREVLVAALVANKGEIARKGIIMAAFKAAKAAGYKGAERTALVAHISSDAFIESGGDDWTSDETNISA
ncbi:hypothetical protein LCGC14_0712760 [marine sediment metagenome]|uniref:Uncharacterized protein n=1 Tax=marine sediment metagenome TaxID=412755 RepID=A0A0F9T078_9ZZZZ